jgi:hypothetical protein
MTYAILALLFAVSGLQASIDSIAATGGTVILQPGATYTDVSLSIQSPNVKILGHRTRLVGVPGQHILRIGDDSPSSPKLIGVEVTGCDFVITGLGVLVGSSDGVLIDDCRFADSPLEALITHSGGIARNTVLRNCHATKCGKGFSAPRSAFNCNGMNERLEYCTATDCGLFAELGGYGTRVRHCTLVNSPIKLGSSGFGCSDLEIANCTLERSLIDCCNPIGKMRDIRFISNRCRNSPFCWQGELDRNLHAIPADWRFSDRASMVVGNVFDGHHPLHEAQALNISPPDHLQTGPLVFASNTIDCPDGYALTVQGRIHAPVRIQWNDFANEYVGQMHLYRGDVPIPDDSAQLRFEGNRGPKGAFLQKHPGGRIGVVQ